MFISYRLSDIRSGQYYMLPKSLFNNSNYSNISLTSKVIYAFLLDRLQLSLDNNWADDNGEVYLIYPRESLATELEVSERTVRRSFIELNESELVREVQRGLGQPNLIYVGKIITDNITSKRGQIDLPERSESPPSNTNINNTKENNTKENKKDLSATSPASISTLFDLKKEEPKKKEKKSVSHEERAEIKISEAKQSKDWSKVKPTDFTYYFIKEHNRLFEKQLTFDRYTSVSIIRDSLVESYDLPLDKVCEYIDLLLRKYKDHPKSNGWLSFNIIAKNRPLMDELIRSLKRELEPVEKKYKTVEDTISEEERKERLEKFKDTEVF